MGIHPHDASMPQPVHFITVGLGSEWMKPSRVLDVSSGAEYYVFCFDLGRDPKVDAIIEIDIVTDWAWKIRHHDTTNLGPGLYVIGPPWHGQFLELPRITKLSLAGAVYLDRDDLIGWAAAEPGFEGMTDAVEILKRDLTLDPGKEEPGPKKRREKTAAGRRKDVPPPPNTFRSRDGADSAARPYRDK